MQPTMDEAIANLYHVFSSYKLRPRIEGCPCCVSREKERTLHERPLRELSGDALDHFARKAISTFGTSYDLRHFLPRLFELTHSKELGVDAEIVLGKLRYAEWDRWPAAERVAVGKYLHAYWLAVLDEESDEWDVEERLCALGCATDVIEPFLAAWIEHSGVHARSALTNWIHSGEALQSPFWSNGPNAKSRVRAFFLDPATAERLSQRFFEADSDSQAVISKALDAVQFFKRTQKD